MDAVLTVELGLTRRPAAMRQQQPEKKKKSLGSQLLPVLSSQRSCAQLAAPGAAVAAAAGSGRAWVSLWLTAAALVGVEVVAMGAGGSLKRGGSGGGAWCRRRVALADGAAAGQMLSGQQ